MFERTTFKWVLLLILFCSNGTFAKTETFKLNYKNEDIRNIVEFVAKKTKKNIIVDPRVKAKITLFSNDSLDIDELFNVFVKILETHSYSIIKENNIYRVLPDQTAILNNIEVYNRKTNKSQNDLVTKVIKLKFINPEIAKKILIPLIPPYAVISTHNESNILIITDRLKNIAKVLKIINNIDVKSKIDVELIKLKYAKAVDIEKNINKLLERDKKKKDVKSKIKIVADIRTNSLMLSGSNIDKHNIKSLIKLLDVEQKNIENIVTLIRLKHVDTDEVKKVLSKIFVQKEKNIEIQELKKINSLVIKSTKNQLIQINNVLKNIDIEKQQILIEAIIAEIKIGDNLENGLQIGANNANSALVTNYSSNEITNISNGSIGKGLTILATNDTMGVLLRTLKANSKTNILSTPSITTVNNSQAEITIGQNVPIVTGSYSSNSPSEAPFQTIEREDIGIKLKVTPQLSDNGKIKLKIYQEVSSLAVNSTSTGITTNKRTINTNVIVRNKETIVLGGLIDTVEQEKEEVIPLLGDIPILGYLFRYTVKESVKINLTVFIKLTILD